MGGTGGSSPPSGEARIRSPPLAPPHLAGWDRMIGRKGRKEGKERERGERRRKRKEKEKRKREEREGVKEERGKRRERRKYGTRHT